MPLNATRVELNEETVGFGNVDQLGAVLLYLKNTNNTGFVSVEICFYCVDKQM